MTNGNKKVSGYGLGSVDTVISVEDVDKQASQLSESAPQRDELLQLANGEPFIEIRDFHDGYAPLNQ